MHAFQDSLTRFRGAVWHALWRRTALFGVTVWCFVVGVLVLAARIVLHDMEVVVWPAAALLLLTVLICRRTAHARLPDDGALAALLDRHNGAGGLLMAAQDGKTEAADVQIVLPRMRVATDDARKPLVAAVLFLLAAPWVPLYRLSGAPAPTPDLSTQTTELAEQVAVLEEVRLTPETRIEALKEALNQMQTGEGDQVAGAWEAFDHLAAAVGREQQAAADRLAAAQDALSRLQALGHALEAQDHPETAAATRELAALYQEQIRDNELLGPALTDAAAPLDGRQIGDLETLNTALAGSAEKAERLAARLVPGNGKQVGGRAAKAGQAELAAYLQEMDPGQSGKCAGLTACLAPGVGPGRGGGPAPLTLRDGNDPLAGRFDEVVLPPSALAADASGRLVARDAVAPEAAETHTAAFDRLSGAAAGSDTAHRQTMLPRHREAVGRFFGRR